MNDQSQDSPKDAAAAVKKLSPLEAKKQLQAAQRQGLQAKSKGVSAVRDDDTAGTAGNTDAPPPRTNTPRRAGGS